MAVRQKTFFIFRLFICLSSPPINLLPSRTRWKDVSGTKQAHRKNTAPLATWVQVRMTPVSQCKEAATVPSLSLGCVQQETVRSTRSDEGLGAGLKVDELFGSMQNIKTWSGECSGAAFWCQHFQPKKIDQDPPGDVSPLIWWIYGGLGICFVVGVSVLLNIIKTWHLLGSLKSLSNGVTGVVFLVIQVLYKHYIWPCGRIFSC